MAKVIRGFDEDGMRRIGKVVRTVENQYGNAKEGKQESRPNRRHLLFVRPHSTIAYLSTGVTCSVLSGHPSSALSTGFGTLVVFGSILGTTSATPFSTGTIVAGWISGYWQGITEACTV